MKAFCRLGSLAALAVLLVGCSQPEPVASAKQLETVKLEKGTKIKAVLLKELTSGGTDEGEEVPMMLSEAIVDEKGRILIAKGTPVSGEVTWSRSEGTLGAITNQPARLKFKFKSVKAVDGTVVNLSAGEDADAEFELNRENTGRSEASKELEALASDTDNKEALEAIRELFESGEIDGLTQSSSNEQMTKIAGLLGMPSTSKTAEQKEVDKLAELVQQIRRGATVTNLATGGSATLVDAALELASVAGQVGNRLHRMIGGRNIRAYVGTPVEGYVLETVEIEIEG